MFGKTKKVLKLQLQVNQILYEKINYVYKSLLGLIVLLDKAGVLESEEMDNAIAEMIQEKEQNKVDEQLRKLLNEIEAKRHKKRD